MWGFFNNETQHPSGIELPCLELTYDVGCGVCWSVGTSCRMYVGLWGSTIVDMMGVLGSGVVWTSYRMYVGLYGCGDVGMWGTLHPVGLR